MDYSIFKAYDIRGIYPSQINAEIAELIGNAFAQFADSKTIIIGRDMRESSEPLFDALSAGITAYGVDVIDIGLVSTDTVYYASGTMNLPGIMITASHNPKEYNGLKFCLAGAYPVSKETGIDKIREMVEKNQFIESDEEGKIIFQEVLEDYKKFALKFIDIKNIKPLKIVVDAGNGMAGKIIPIFFKDLPVVTVPLYFDLDGTFPNHPASPIEEKNLIDLIKKVKEEKADLGMAFDGDADRVFFIDENGKTISGAITVAIIARDFLIKNPGETIIYDLRCSKTVPEIIKEFGGTPVMDRVGHSYIKKTMKETGAIFAGEFSGHYYYRDNFRADSGIITALMFLEVLSTAHKKTSELIKEFSRYHQIEETNFEVVAKDKKIAEIKEKYADGKLTELDGITIEYKDWWFNVRASNTEPVLRLNLEAETEKLMLEKKLELSNLLKTE